MLVDATAVAVVVGEEVVVELEDSVLVPTVVEEGVSEEVVCETGVKGTVDVLVRKIVLVLEVSDAAELVALDTDNQLKPLSRQIPEVQGSVAQQPRKLPAEQTYHCFGPSHVVESRRFNASILKVGPASGWDVAAKMLDLQSVKVVCDHADRQCMNEWKRGEPRNSNQSNGYIRNVCQGSSRILMPGADSKQSCHIKSKMVRSLFSES